MEQLPLCLNITKMYITYIVIQTKPKIKRYAKDTTHEIKLVFCRSISMQTKKAASGFIAGRGCILCLSSFVRLHAHTLHCQYVVPNQKLNQHPLQFNHHILCFLSWSS